MVRCALVGPRPARPAEVAGPAQRNLLVKPGMTGLWQLLGDDAVTAEQAATVDLRYVERWTPALDAWILFRTISTVCGQRFAALASFSPA